MKQHIAFIGGGNMASAIINGLVAQGFPKSQITIVEPWQEARDKLQAHFGLQAHASAGSFLSEAEIVVWAVKPQAFKEAARQARFFARGALHLSVAAGISSGSIAKWLSSERIVRAMPNTPALIGKGITGLFARAGVSDDEQHAVVQIVKATGDFLWVDKEEQLDAVTALSGSGPA